MSVPEKIFWCDCLWDIVRFIGNIEKAKDILSWAEKHGYERPTRGAITAIEEANRNLRMTMSSCNFYADENQEAQRLLSEAKGKSTREALSLVSRANELVRRAISVQCKKERQLKWEGKW